MAMAGWWGPQEWEPSRRLLGMEVDVEDGLVLASWNGLALRD